MYIDRFKALIYKLHHSIQLCKLKYYSIYICSYDFLNSYLTGRSHDVEFSGQSQIHCLYQPDRVPQGSVLGPLLFLIDINDLVSNVLT